MSKVDMSTYVPDFAIFIDGQLQDDLRNSAASISISEKIGDPAQFTLVIADKFDIKTQKFLWLEKFLSKNSPLYDDKKTIEILMGYTGNLKKIITAHLKTISTSGFSSEITKLTLIGYDISHKILKEQTTEDNLIEKNDTYHKIAIKLAERAKLKPIVDETKLYKKNTTIKAVSYIDFLKDAANKVGFVFLIARGILFFIDPRKERTINGQAIITLEWNLDLQEFTPTINTADLVPSVIIRGRLPNSKKAVEKKALPGSENVVGGGNITGSQLAMRLGNKIKEITDRNFNSEEEALDIAKAELNNISDRLITASGSIIGNPNLFPGQFIDVKGLGKQLSDKYFVTEVTNTIDGSGYKTSINFRKNSINNEE